MIEVKKELAKFTPKEIDFKAKLIPEKEIDIYNFIHQVKGMEQAVDQQVNRIEELTSKIQIYQGTMKQKEMQVYDLVCAFIDMIDDLEEFIEKGQKQQEIKNLIEKGIQTLNTIGIRRIRQKGAKFDPELHQIHPKDNINPDGKIVKEVIQDGYMNIQAGHVIRKATVIVE